MYPKSKELIQLFDETFDASLPDVVKFREALLERLECQDGVWSSQMRKIDSVVNKLEVITSSMKTGSVNRTALRGKLQEVTEALKK